jgi:hypothetical protein
MGGMKFHEELRASIALARWDPTVARAGDREGALLAEGEEK